MLVISIALGALRRASSSKLQRKCLYAEHLRRNSKYLRNILSTKVSYIHNMYLTCRCFIKINAHEGSLYSQLTLWKEVFLRKVYDGSVYLQLLLCKKYF